MRTRPLAGLLAATFALSAAGLSAASLSQASPAPPATSRPNVVFILLDDARYDDLSTLPKIVSRIGDAGATFSNFYAPFPLCCPARATLLTGQYAHNHQVLDNHAPLGGFSKFNDTSTLATWLTPTYTTALIGKYFNEYRPPYHPPGWDEWMVPYAMYDYTNPTWSVDTGSGAQDVDYPGYQTDTMGMLAADFIQRHASDAKPFFLYTSLVAPHAGLPADPDDTREPTPYVKPKYRETFAGRTDKDPSFDEPNISDKPLQPAPLTASEITAMTEVNAQRRESELSAQDATVRILNALSETGTLDNTYVIFMSDNGYSLGEHRIQGGKVGPYQVDNRLPLLVRGPGIAPGTAVHQLSAQVDFAPTVLAMADNIGANGSSSIDGINLLPFLTRPANAQTSRKAVVLEAGPGSPKATAYRYHGVRSGAWKYVERPGGARELYNLVYDPYELNNVAARDGFTQNPTQQSAQARMKALLDTYEWCAGRACR